MNLVGLDAVATTIRLGCKHHSNGHPVVAVLLYGLVLLLRAPRRERRTDGQGSGDTATIGHYNYYRGHRGGSTKSTNSHNYRGIHGSTHARNNCMQSGHPCVYRGRSECGF